MNMSEKEIDRVVNNEIEWRKFLLRRVEKIEENQIELFMTVNGLKIKFGLIGTFFGAIGGTIATVITTILTRKV